MCVPDIGLSAPHMPNLASPLRATRPTGSVMHPTRELGRVGGRDPRASCGEVFRKGVLSPQILITNRQRTSTECLAVVSCAR